MAPGTLLRGSDGIDEYRYKTVVYGSGVGCSFIAPLRTGLVSSYQCHILLIVVLYMALLLLDRLLNKETNTKSWTSAIMIYHFLALCIELIIFLKSVVTFNFTWSFSTYDQVIGHSFALFISSPSV